MISSLLLGVTASSNSSSENGSGGEAIYQVGVAHYTSQHLPGVEVGKGVLGSVTPGSGVALQLPVETAPRTRDVQSTIGIVQLATDRWRMFGDSADA